VDPAGSGDRPARDAPRSGNEARSRSAVDAAGSAGARYRSSRDTTRAGNQAGARWADDSARTVAAGDRKADDAPGPLAARQRPRGQGRQRGPPAARRRGMGDTGPGREMEARDPTRAPGSAPRAGAAPGSTRGPAAAGRTARATLGGSGHAQPALARPPGPRH